MNYIYDIYINFKNIPYDFFEWNYNDNIIHLKKIPALKIDDNTFKSIYCNKIRINTNILKSIENKTEIWKSKNRIKYSLLLCTNKDILILKFDDNGNSVKKSKLYIDEELEIINQLKNIKYKKIKFKIIKKNKIKLQTRSRIKKYNFIKKQLEKTTYEQRKYLYFECFNIYDINKNISLDLNKIYNNKKIFEKLYNILKLISTNQK